MKKAREAMRRARWLQSITIFSLSLSVVALVLDLSARYALRVNVDDSMAVDDSFTLDSDGTYDPHHPLKTLSATPPDGLLTSTTPMLVAFHVILLVETPRSVLVVRITAPRAPPTLA